MKAVRTILTLIGAMLAIGITTACADSTDIHLQSLDLKRDLTYKAGNGFVDVLKGDTQVARFNYNQSTKPFIYPLNAPCGSAVTSNEPVSADAKLPAGDPSNLSFWVGCGSVNGVDFWNEGDKCGKVVQNKIDFEPMNAENWNIHVVNDWNAPDGTRVCEEERRYSFVSCRYGTLIATLVTLTPDKREVKLDDTLSGFYGIHLAPGLQYKTGKGQILNSEGQTNADCNGKRARWLDATGYVNGKTCGITVFDAPFNVVTPTYWGVTDSGIITANPFGGKSFTGDPANDTSTTIKRGQSLSLLYIALIHDGKFSKDMLDDIAGQVVGKPLPKTDDSAVKDDKDAPKMKSGTVITSGAPSEPKTSKQEPAVLTSKPAPDAKPKLAPVAKPKPAPATKPAPAKKK